MNKKKGLGRGLSSLINDDNNLQKLIGNVKEGETVLDIDVGQIKANPYQPRKEFDLDELQSLADSIKAQGLLQPVVVRKIAGNQYELVAGERRLRAAKLAGLDKIMALVRNYTDAESMNLALLENLQRADLNPMEVAAAYERLMREGGMTQDELSKKLGIKRSSIANTLRLLNLPDEVQNYVRSGKLNESGARSLAGLPNFDSMKNMAQLAIQNGWSTKDIESNVAIWKNKHGNDVRQRGEGIAQKSVVDRQQTGKKNITHGKQIQEYGADAEKFIHILELASGEQIEIVPIAGTKAKVLGFKFVTDEDLKRIYGVFSKLIRESKETQESSVTKKFTV